MTTANEFNSIETQIKVAEILLSEAEHQMKMFKKKINTPEYSESEVSLHMTVSQYLIQLAGDITEESRSRNEYIRNNIISDLRNTRMSHQAIAEKYEVSLHQIKSIEFEMKHGNGEHHYTKPAIEAIYSAIEENESKPKMERMSNDELAEHLGVPPHVISYRKKLLKERLSKKS